MSKDAVTSAPGKENKSLDMNQLNTVNEPKVCLEILNK